MNTIKRLLAFTNNPSSVVQGNANQSAIEGNTGNRPEPLDRLPIYRSRSHVGNRISHKNHKHIDDTTKYEIYAIDDQIVAALNAGKPEEIAVHLNALLDKTFFDPAVEHGLLDALTAAFDRLDQCDIIAGDDEIDKYAREFAKEFEASAALGGRKDDIVAKARKYLKSIRADKSQFQEELSQSFKAVAQRCSAQKMALKTFESAFPVVAKTSGEDAVDLLKKLITVLPDLEHHKIVERNAQRRGVKVLEKALEHLTHDQVAEVLAATMESLALISTDVSNSLIEGGVRRRLTNVRLYAAEGVAVVTGVSIFQLLATGAGAAAATGFGVIPVGVITAAYGLGRYWTIDKQALGTALYMFSRKLEDLRKNWDKVSPENKERLTASFEKMRNKIPDLSALKRSTAKRIHNDKFLDPSAFGKSNAAMELAKRAKHCLIAPITTRLNRFRECESVGVRGFESATANQKKLCRLLESYHAEARRAGMLDAEIPEELLENLLAHTEALEYATAVGNLTHCFNRVRKNNNIGGMPEYENPVTKPKILKQIVEMTKRLATGDKDFVQRFVTTARLAEEDCHNNARQIFKKLWTAVLVDKAIKAIKGEDGLDDDLTLLRLGMGFFREELLDTAKFEVLGEDINVETGAAVEIALGKTLGLPDPIEGMGYFLSIRSYTREDLGNIKNKVLDKAKDRELFIDFLAEWDPLAERIKKAIPLKPTVKRKLASSKSATTTPRRLFSQ